MVEGDALTAKHALELEWHEAHAAEGDDDRISKYKKVVLARLRERQWAMLGDLTRKRVLDVGCGVGRETVELARRGADVVGIDLSPTLVAKARTRAADAGVAGRVELKVSAAEELTCGPDSFDVVIANGVLHHLDIPTFKRTLVGLMKPGGVAQFADPLAHNPLLRLYRWLTPHLHSPTEHALTDADIRMFVEGFRDVSIQYFNLTGLVFLPAPYLVGEVGFRALLSITLQCDRAVFRMMPSLRFLCQYVIIQVRAPGQ